MYSLLVSPPASVGGFFYPKFVMNVKPRGGNVSRTVFPRKICVCDWCHTGKLGHGWVGDDGKGVEFAV